MNLRVALIWSWQTTRPRGRVGASRSQEITRPPGRVEDITTSPHHSTSRSSVFISITWPSLDHITRPRGRVSSPPLPDHHSTTSLYLEVEYHLPHHSTTPSMASFRVFFIPHSTRHSSTKKKRRLQLFTRPPTRPPGSSIVIILLLHYCYHVFNMFNVYAFCYDVWVVNRFLRMG